MGDPVRKRPRSFNQLESYLGEYAREEGLAPGRVRQSISYTVIAAVLERVRAYDEATAFLVKGGVAIERRLDRPRTTKDFDAVFLDPGRDLIDVLDQAFAEPYDGWTLRRHGEPEALDKAIRITVRLDYEGRSWATVPIEISEPEGSVVPPERLAAFDLGRFGLRGPETISCLPLRRQAAQKIHALTEPPRPGRDENPRFRDLLDLWRLRLQIPVDLDLRAECIQTFRRRRIHAWPPTIVVYPSWPEALEQLARKDGIEFPGAEPAAADVKRLIVLIDALADRAFAREFAEIPDILRRNTDLRDAVHALVETEAMGGKILAGGNRLERFRQVMERLVSREIDLAEAVRRTREHIGTRESPWAWSKRVFSSHWEDRLVWTQYSRFYNQAVLQLLIREDRTVCFVPHSRQEKADTYCAIHLAGRKHDSKALLEALQAGYVREDWSRPDRIPQHPHCTHVVTPVEDPSVP